MFSSTLTPSPSCIYENFIDVNNTFLPKPLKIMSWNINGDLKAKMLCPEFTNIIKQYDICLLQETHLYPLEHESLNLPDSFKVISLPRKYKKTFMKQFGGVIALFNRRLDVSYNKDLSSSDIMVLALNNLILVNAYILPEYQTWDAFTDVDPFQRLQETLTALQELSQPVLIMGDLNARTGYRSTPQHTRKSKDDHLSTRGRALIDSCMHLDLILLNGIQQFESKTQSFTSFQPRGQAVVDYVIANKTGLDLTLDFEVLVPTLEWSDHATLSLELMLPGEVEGTHLIIQTRQTSHNNSSWKHQMIQDSNNPLDALQIKIMREISTPTAKLIRLYGFPTPSTKVIEVYTDGSCHGNSTRDARAGSGVFWGMNAPNNLATRVPGKQTNNRSELYAILKAIHLAPNNLSLKIFTDSVYAIKSLAEWAPKSAEKAWNIENGDIIHDCVKLIRYRQGPVSLVQVKGHSGNKHNDAADRLAKDGSCLPPIGDYIELGLPDVTSCPMAHVQPSHSAVPKVTATYLPTSEAQKTSRVASAELVDEASLPSHRGREKVRDTKILLRDKLLNCENEKMFWKIAKELMNGKESLSQVSADDLKLVFENRMNPLSTTPESFDSSLLKLNLAMAKAIPLHTLDLTFEQYFSKPFSVDEISNAKAHLEGRKNSARGADHIGYREILEVDNSALASLLNLAVEKCDAPASWLSTIIVAIIKTGKQKDDPNNYRAVGLESCLLKLMTLLIHMRLTAWCDKYNILPPSQNGFRTGYRTNNNAFILRCAIDRARAEGKTLYVMFADISNAFPSTEQSTLWLKLRSLGAGGMIFDWIRMIYDRMEYVVRHNSETSEVFKSISGILIGDTCSPILWNIYLADIKFLISNLDIKLDGCHISHLEQADDVVLMSTSAEGLQERMDSLAIWCSKNFMLLNAIKSVGIIYGPIPQVVPPLKFGVERVPISEKQSYIGVTVLSTDRNIFKLHYDLKAGKAKKTGNMILALQSVIGKLPPWELRKLYMALIDPHLTHGAEICLDINPPLLEKLEDIQHRFLGRVLNVGEKCLSALLFTETAIIPIKYRRIITALKYMKYLLQMPSDSYSSHAMRDSINLAMSGKPGWVMDILYVLKNLPFNVTTLNLTALTPQNIDDTIKSVNRGLANHLQQIIDTSPKSYLLTGRLEQDDMGKFSHKTLYFRNYLNVANYKHRKAITHILLSCHSLAVERLRWHRPVSIPRAERLCRFCKQKIETPEHALLDCKSNAELVNIHEHFSADISKINPDLLDTEKYGLTQCLKNLISSKDTVSRVSQLAHDVLEIFDKYPIYVPNIAAH